MIVKGIDRDTFPWQGPVISRTLATPPGSPPKGDRYIVPSGATGAWSGKDGQITEWTGTIWEFYTPVEGWEADVKDEDRVFRFSGTVWSIFVAPKTVDLPFRGSTGPFVESSSQTYETLYRWIFAGSTRMGVPVSIEALAWREVGTGNVDLRIYDVDNLAVIAEYLGITTGEPAIFDLGTLANVPADETIFEFQMKVGVGTKGRASALQLKW